MPAKEVNSCVKCFLIIINILFMIFGGAILGVGIYLFMDKDIKFFNDLIPDFIRNLATIRITMLATGIFIILLTFAGCAGAWLENKCLTIFYSVFIGILLILSITIVALTIVYHGRVKSKVVGEVAEKIRVNYGAEDDYGNTITQVVNDIQVAQQCCGTINLRSNNVFRDTPWYRKQTSTGGGGSATKLQVPVSCCNPTLKDKSKCTHPDNFSKAIDDGYIFSQGCVDKFLDKNGLILQMILAVVALTILVMLISFVCAIVVIRQINHSDGLHV